jgi:hypothetical protein
MRPRLGLAHWGRFSALFIEAVEQYRSQHKSIPSETALKEAGHIRLVRAAYDHHGGYKHVIITLGYPLPQRTIRYPSGRNTWESIRLELVPIAEAWLDREGRLPSKRELELSGHGGLSRAIFRHHHGLKYVYHRLGYKRDQRKHNGHPFRQNWYSKAIQRAALQRLFPEYLAWGFVPSSTTALKRIRGLVRYSWRKGGWAKVALGLNLLPYRAGCRQQKIVMAISEALTYYERQRRWPTNSQSSVNLVNRQRDVRLRGEAFTKYRQLNPRALEHLTRRWQQHGQWAKLHQPERMPVIIHQVNQLILERHQREPIRPDL